MDMGNNSEARVGEFLTERKIVFKSEYPSSDRMYYFDFYLSDGLGKIKIGGKDIEVQGRIGIEVKERLLFDTIGRYYTRFKKYKQNGEIEWFILIYKDSFIDKQLINDATNKLANEHFLVLSLDDFLKLNIQGVKNQVQPDSPKSSQAVENPLCVNSEILEKAYYSFQQGNVVLFLGAGVSKSANMPDWYGLLKNMCASGGWKREDIDTLMQEYNGSDIVLGRFIRLLLNLKSTDSEYIRRIRDNLYSGNTLKKESKLVDALCELIKTGKVESIITYNYDDIMEYSLSERGKECYPVYGNNTPKNIFPIYHIHGYIPRSNAESTNLPTPILSEETYHDIYADSYDWSNIEQLHAMNRSTCFFIGLSMRDPNLRRLLDISHRKSDGTCRHFLFLPIDELFKDEYKNRKALNGQTRMFEELGLNVIWYDNKTGTHEKLPNLLREIGGYKKK